jgi:hypothetical protein
VVEITNADPSPADLTNYASSAAQSEVSELETIVTEVSEPDDRVSNDPPLDIGVGAITATKTDGLVDNDSLCVHITSMKSSDTSRNDDISDEASDGYTEVPSISLPQFSEDGLKIVPGQCLNLKQFTFNQM